MRTAIYARVSTENRGQESTNQLAQLRAFAASQSMEIVAEFVDTATGGNSDRPAFQKMFEAASRKEFDCLIFWALDRLSREGVLPTLNHLNRLDGYGVAYRSLQEPYLDSCGLFKDAVVAIMAVLARQEKIRIQERTKAGLARVRAAGTRLGHAPAVIDHTAWASLRAQGLSGRECARRLGWHESTLRRHAKATFRSAGRA